jgi:hypothetical protein
MIFYWLVGIVLLTFFGRLALRASFNIGSFHGLYFLTFTVLLGGDDFRVFSLLRRHVVGRFGIGDLI